LNGDYVQQSNLISGEDGLFYRINYFLLYFSIFFFLGTKLLASLDLEKWISIWSDFKYGGS
jgi:hypothetical protein